MLIRWFTPHAFVTLGMFYRAANVNSLVPTPRLRLLVLFYRLQAHPTAVGGLYFSNHTLLRRYSKNTGAVNWLRDNYVVFAGRSPKSENKLRSILQPLCLQNLPIVNRSSRTVRSNVRWQSPNESSPKLEA